MGSKGFFASKLNWLGIATFVAGLSALSDQLPPEISKWLLIAAGIATVALRTFGTSTSIAGVK